MFGFAKDPAVKDGDRLAGYRGLWANPGERLGSVLPESGERYRDVAEARQRFREYADPGTRWPSAQPGAHMVLYPIVAGPDGAERLVPVVAHYLTLGPLAGQFKGQHLGRKARQMQHGKKR
jgi:hypothetical protein